MCKNSLSRPWIINIQISKQQSTEISTHLYCICTILASSTLIPAQRFQQNFTFCHQHSPKQKIIRIYTCLTLNINIITVILPKDIQVAHKGGFLFHKSPSRAMARGHSYASSKTAHVGSIQDGDGIWSRLQPTGWSSL